MSEIGIGVIFLVLLLGLFLTGLELAFAMGIIGIVGFAWLVNWKAAMGLMANDFFDALASYSLTVIPLFVLMGQIAFNAGIAKRLFDCAHKFRSYTRRPGDCNCRGAMLLRQYADLQYHISHICQRCCARDEKAR